MQLYEHKYKCSFEKSLNRMLKLSLLLDTEIFFYKDLINPLNFYSMTRVLYIIRFLILNHRILLLSLYVIPDHFFHLLYSWGNCIYIIVMMTQDIQGTELAVKFLSTLPSIPATRLVEPLVPPGLKEQVEGMVSKALGHRQFNL